MSGHISLSQQKLNYHPVTQAMEIPNVS